MNFFVWQNDVFSLPCSHVDLDLRFQIHAELIHPTANVQIARSSEARIIGAMRQPGRYPLE